MQPVIEISNLTKLYDQRMAVDNLELTVNQGDIFGFVGPNGAGKTSTIRMMATLLEPTRGQIRIAGHSVHTEPRQVRHKIGYMPDFFGVYDDMKLWEYLDFFAACYHIPEIDRAHLIDELLELVDLKHRREDMVDSLSRGMKQRLSLARTLVNDPQVLILDEPASGLDPRARVEIRELLVELSRMGKTIFFSTHILSDVAEICNRVAIIEAGKLIATGALEELQLNLMPRRVLQLTVLGAADQAKDILSKSEGVQNIEELPAGIHSRSRLRFEFTGPDTSLSAMLAMLVSQGIQVLHFNEDQRDLEEVFLHVTKGLVT